MVRFNTPPATFPPLKSETRNVFHIVCHIFPKKKIIKKNTTTVKHAANETLGYEMCH